MTKENSVGTKGHPCPTCGWPFVKPVITQREDSPHRHRFAPDSYYEPVEKLIERLETPLRLNPRTDIEPLVLERQEAATMLRSLAAEKSKVEELVKQYEAIPVEDMEEELATLRAKLERAREGLEDIAGYHLEDDASNELSLESCIRVARAILEEIEDART